MKAIHLLWLGLVLSVLLAACQKDKEPVPVPVNKLVAAAGADQTVPVRTAVQLDGSASRDGNGKDFAYAWSLESKPDGSGAALAQAFTVRPTFTPDLPGTYVVKLQIANAGGKATDGVIITATAVTDPAEPTAGILNADITTDRHLPDIFTDPSRPDYLVTADVKVNARLSVAPGVVVAFQGGKGLIVTEAGTLVGRGTATQPVVFTGTNSVKGAWKGLWVFSNRPENALDHATVAYGGGQDLPGAPGSRANLILAGTAGTAAAMQLTNTRFTDGDGYGVFVHGSSQVAQFANNAFANLAGPALFIPAGQVHRLDAASRLTGNNGFNGVETRGTVPGAGEVTWPVFADGSSYRLTGDLTVAGGLVLPEGARLAFLAAAALEVQESGFLAAVGSAAKPVVFTAATPAANGYWGGIVVRSASDRNRLHYAEVSYVGGKDLPELPNARANVVVSNTGRLSLQQSVVAHGTGWGVVAYRDQGAQVNEDVAVVNQFSDLALGAVKLAALAETTTLVGDWLDAWSFSQGNAWSDAFYDRATGRWFNGAPTPWTMTPAGGFGLRIGADGSFAWTIAEHGPAAGCGNAYSAEYILGKVTPGGDQLSFVQSYWRSRFFNPCNPGGSVDTEVEPSTIPLRYEIYRETAGNGQPRWVLKLINPDGSSFRYYRR